MTKEHLVEDLTKQFSALAQKAEKGDAAKELTAFLVDLYSTGAPEDLLLRGADELFEAGRMLWKTAETRKPGTCSVKVVGPLSKDAIKNMAYTAVYIVNDDMPFLVDSVTGGLASAMNHRIHMMHHPIVDVPRDPNGKRSSGKGAERIRESYMYVEIDALSDASVVAELQTALEKILIDVRDAVTDWRAMLAKIDETVASLTVNPPPIGQEDVNETIQFLRWLGADHFTFLGFREYRFDGDPATFDFNQVDGTALGILRDPDRYVLRDANGLTPMSPEIRDFLTKPDPVIITKANVKSTVHRHSHLDYIGVKIFDAEGNAVGERRFVGLFTSLSYSQFAHDVPLIRGKVAKIQERARLGNRSFAGKALAHILENFPRDELFQVGEDWLYETTLGVLQLTERPRPRAFIRADQFGRFVSAMVYVPRDTYHSGLRVAITDILCNAYNGELSVYYAKLSEEALARWHFIIRTTPGEVPKVEDADIQQQIIEAAQGWDDRLHLSLVSRRGEEAGNNLYHLYKTRFSAAYRESFTPEQASYDVVKLEEVDGKDDLRVDFYRHLGDGDARFRLKIYHGITLIPLSSCMPVLENLGFKILYEHSHEVGGNAKSYIHDFSLEYEASENLDFDAVKPLVESLFTQVWNGICENDSLNQLVLSSGMDWTQIVLLRAYGKYLRQLGMGYSPDYFADTVVKNAGISKLLIELFEAQFKPKYDGDRSCKNNDLTAAIGEMLETVKSLDHDRILRAYANVIGATLRTNFYQDGVVDRCDERALAFKIRSREVEEAPLPRPFAEIWVYSPQVEGVHLRGGPIARGGLRWSDRREDFRTEVLGLVKAQQVKNAVIVPQGSKGGFFPKQLPVGGDRDAFMKEGVASYRSFITSLLSVTDNLKAGKAIAPKQTVRRDGADPYLVVAADKGTATFSDIANGISQGRDFWLDDAFASGGSAGYDHKKMGITAKGAWVSVQRLFRERGLNTQKDEFTVIGVGDMSGDVFGNGMLLSKKIRLQAAFNHLHIFIDPNPGDTAKAWKERKRLFDTPGTAWTDYDNKLISKGGGIFSRADKAIKLSPEIKAWLNIEEDSLAPTVLINRILKAQADLLWFGGIGTYVRATTETDIQVGDRANDALRVTSEELNVTVVGEGGNLGMTQKSRIEFARRRGRLNTDFIDNSAGVDCSDKEVNIKILLTDAIAKGSLKAEDRNALLEAMTDDVSDIVLSDNYLQTQAISLAEAQAVPARHYHHGLIRALERDGDLNREIENLPSDEGFSELAANDQGLTRPEISTLMAYAKMSLFDTLIKSDLINDPVLQPELEWGFPPVLRERFAEELSNHQLRREIIATVLANEVVNWAGLTFVFEVKEETGLGVEDIVAAFVIVREVFGLQEKWDAINALDYKVPASVQYDMHQSVSDSLKNQVLWFLRNMPQPFNVSEMIDRFKQPFEKLFGIKQDVLSKPTQTAFLARRDGFKDEGVGHELATFVAAFQVLDSGPDIIIVAEETGKSVDYVAGVHFALGDMLSFDWLRQRSERIVPEDHWETLATRAIIEDLGDQQRGLVKDVCEGAGSQTIKQATGAWRKSQTTRVIRAGRLAEDLRSSGSLSVAKLSFAARHLRSILR